MGRRFRSGLALAAATLLLSACGESGDTGLDGALGDAPKGVADVKKAPLGQEGTISLMFCTDRPDSQGDTVFGVTLRSFSAKDGKLVAERYAVTPSDFEPASGCEGDGPTKPATSAFSKDLSMLAGISDSSRAAAVDTATGQEIAPPDPDAFGKDLGVEDVAFHPETDELWYNSDPDHIGSSEPMYFRDVKGGPATQKSVPYEQIGARLAKGGAMARTILAADGYQSPISPSGVVAIHNDSEGLGLWRPNIGGDQHLKQFESAALGKGNNDKPENCNPAFWRDDTTLVCHYDSLTQLTFSPDHQRVTKTVELLPESDRNTVDPTPSPDGKSFVFLSRNANDQWVLYRSEFATPGAQPVKVAALDLPIDGADDHRVSLVRWN
ncbi:hypothetical protein AB0B30_26000 [Streptomyces narbonensis]|uniref:WD40 repeat protein n=1 Tax=Streptomyces narbonensis TaxID=67333 RepID=A0ABV3CB25_9ACTN